MNRPTRAAVCLAALATAGAAVLSTATTALAAPSTDVTNSAQPSPSADNSAQRLAQIQARAAAAIAQRLGSLNAAIIVINANRALTADHKSTLLATMNNDISGLTALGQKIAADTTVAQATTDYQQIFLGYRVYALAIPQARFVAASDDIDGLVVPHLTDAQTRLAALLAGPLKSKDTPAIDAAMADLGAKIADATAKTNGLASTVLGYTPADYNANHALLAGARSSLETAHADCKAARADIATVVAALRASLPATTPSASQS